MVMNNFVDVVVQWLVVVVFVVIVGVLELVMDFREVMLTSTPELAHCAPSLPPQFSHCVYVAEWTLQYT